MKTLRIYNILTEDGRNLKDIVLSVSEDHDWVDVFTMLSDATGEDVDSYSYEEIAS